MTGMTFRPHVVGCALPVPSTVETPHSGEKITNPMLQSEPMCRKDEKKTSIAAVL